MRRQSATLSFLLLTSPCTPIHTATPLGRRLKGTYCAAANHTFPQSLFTSLTHELRKRVIDRLLAVTAKETDRRVFKSLFIHGGIGRKCETSEIRGVVVETGVQQLGVVGGDNGFGEEGLETSFGEVVERGGEKGVDFLVCVAEGGEVLAVDCDCLINFKVG